jgi:hypothetical protein
MRFEIGLGRVETGATMTTTTAAGPRGRSDALWRVLRGTRG